MPAYFASSASRPLDALYPGDSKTVWDAESPGTGAKSIAVNLATGFTPFSGLIYVSVEVHFSGAPGTFEIQVEDSDTEAEANYCAMAFGGASPGLINAVNANNTVRVELLVKAKFVRLKMTDDPANAITTTAKISR